MLEISLSESFMFFEWSLFQAADLKYLLLHNTIENPFTNAMESISTVLIVQHKLHGSLT